MGTTEKTETRREIKYADWIAEAKRRFGDDSHAWKFVCPSCGHVASVGDWKEAGAPENAIAFSCVGRYAKDGSPVEMTRADKAFKGKGGPCNYTGGGLFKLNPVTVIDIDGHRHQMFEFAPGGA